MPEQRTVHWTRTATAPDGTIIKRGHTLCGACGARIEVEAHGEAQPVQATCTCGHVDWLERPPG